VLRFRPATDDDAGFLAQCLAMAADWRPGATVRDVDQILAVPELAHYVLGWPQPGDFGVIAEDGRPVGAAWWRYLSAADPGYGYVRDDVPELSIAVAPGHRRTGVGWTLLERLLAEAQARELVGVSLSVETDNGARRLYESVGFRTVSDLGGALTMLWTPGVDGGPTRG